MSMRAFPTLLAVLIVILAGTLAQERRKERAAPADAPRTIKVDGLERSYRVVATAGAKKPMPLVFVLHGGSLSERGSNHMIRHTDFGTLAKREGFIAVFPQGVYGNWNDGRGVQFIRAHKENIDDVKFLRRVVDDIAKTHPVDRSRIFSTGISNGAFMSHRLAADASDLVAGIAPVVGGMSPPIAERFEPIHPVSLFVIQGDADPLVPYAGGGVGLNPRRPRGQALATEKALAKYVERYGIKGEPTTTLLPDTDPKDSTTTEATIYPTAPSGAIVQIYRVKGGGHTWPGARKYMTEKLVGKTGRDFDATEAIWEFFKSCPSRKID
jgi:polyhydroxybutyrate depolymerase